MRIATDYSGYHGGRAARRVTMNKAHSTHYTDTRPRHLDGAARLEPRGRAAKHAVTIGDVLIRNVPTDINRYGTFEADGNSIFIVEASGLCIGHLGPSTTS